MSVFEMLMQFCPRCGRRLDSPEEPAACRFCGWEEGTEHAVRVASENQRPTEAGASLRKGLKLK